MPLYLVFVDGEEKCAGIFFDAAESSVPSALVGLKVEKVVAKGDEAEEADGAAEIGYFGRESDEDSTDDVFEAIGGVTLP